MTSWRVFVRLDGCGRRSIIILKAGNDAEYNSEMQGMRCGVFNPAGNDQNGVPGMRISMGD